MAKLPQLVALVVETDVDVSETPPPPPLDPAILTSRVFVAAKYVTELPDPTKLSVDIPTFFAITIPAD